MWYPSMVHKQLPEHVMRPSSRDCAGRSRRRGPRARRPAPRRWVPAREPRRKRRRRRRSVQRVLPRPRATSAACYLLDLEGMMAESLAAKHASCMIKLYTIGSQIRFSRVSDHAICSKYSCMVLFLEHSWGACCHRCRAILPLLQYRSKSMQKFHPSKLLGSPCTSQFIKGEPSTCQVMKRRS